MTVLRELDRWVSAPEAPAPAIVLRDVTRRHGRGTHATPVFDGVSITVPRGEFLCVVGPSGCGKSTLLNLLAHLDRPNSGTVDVAARPALMFQDAALFPWLTVAQNIAFPMRMAHTSRAERGRRVNELLRTVRLDGVGGKRPHQLSGGMRQRVALARALAQEGEILLMDEPFAALDNTTRDLLHDEVEQVWQATGLTIVFVTHNVAEAVRLADRVLLLAGRPAVVAAEYRIDLPRPRRGDSPEALARVAEITERLRKEAMRHVRI